MKKSAPKTVPQRVTGLSWWLGVPRPSYSAAHIVRIFENEWDVKTTMKYIRNAIWRGELHPHRVGVTNMFERCEVSRFVSEYHPSRGAVLAHEAILSGWADVCIPMPQLIEMLLAAESGGATGVSALPLEVREGDKGDGAGPAEGHTPWPRAIGVRRNPTYPAPNTDHFMKTPPDLSDEVPGLRTRIKADSLRAKRRHAWRKKKPDGSEE